MKVQVRLFAGLAEAAGSRSFEIDWEGGSAADLVRDLSALRPELALRFEACRVAVDQEFVSKDAWIDRPREVALVPPVSGG